MTSISRPFSLLAASCLLSLSGTAIAQPADLPIPPATTDHYPQNIHIAKTGSGSVYVDGRGRVLYGMDMRTVLRAGPDPSRYCQDACSKNWDPVLAPADTAPNIQFPLSNRENAPAKDGLVTQANAPDWTVIAGPQGPQWVYKGWHMVFTRHGDRPGSIAYDGDENRVWNTMKFVPPVPKVAAPDNVRPAFVDGRYLLATEDGRLLFTGECKSACSDWRPLPAAMASAPMGPWAVRADGDTPQWSYHGKPVFVAQGDGTDGVPAAGKPLQP